MKSGLPHTPPQAADIIARRNAAMAEELGLLIDGATNYAIYMLDPEGRVTIWNRGAERIKGWTEAEIVGRSATLFYSPGDVKAGKPQEDLDRASALGRIDGGDRRVLVQGEFV